MIELRELEILEPVELYARGLIDAPQARPEPWRLNADKLISLGWTVEEVVGAHTLEGHLPETARIIARSAFDRWNASNSGGCA